MKNSVANLQEGRSDKTLAIRSNPGGLIADPSQEVVGRDDLAGRCWRILEGQSIVLSSDRREGKTWFLKKMGAECPQEVIWLFCEAEGASSVGELLDGIHDTARRHLHFRTRAFAGTLEFLEKILGQKVGSFSLPAVEGVWKKALAAILDDLCGQAEGRRVVLVIDEFPYLLHKLRRSDARQAMELLDVLRAHRQMRGASLRMILAGSIGLHLVLAELRGHGYRNEPVNDTETVPVPPLAQADAEYLARCLWRGAGLREASPEIIAALVKESGDIPYYLHRLVYELESSPSRTWSAEDIGALLGRLIEDPQDPLNLAHYRDRIQTYYPAGEQEAICDLLDRVAEAEGRIDLPKLIQTAQGQHPQHSPARLGRLVELLEKDHYLRRAGNEIEFASPIVRKWWRYRRCGISVATGNEC